MNFEFLQAIAVKQEGFKWDIHKLSEALQKTLDGVIISIEELDGVEAAVFDLSGVLAPNRSVLLFSLSSLGPVYLKFFFKEKATPWTGAISHLPELFFEHQPEAFCNYLSFENQTFRYFNQTNDPKTLIRWACLIMQQYRERKSEATSQDKFDELCQFAWREAAARSFEDISEELLGNITNYQSKHPDEPSCHVFLLEVEGDVTLFGTLPNGTILLFSMLVLAQLGLTPKLMETLIEVAIEHDYDAYAIAKSLEER